MRCLCSGAGWCDVIITGRTVGAREELDDAIKASGAHATIVEHDMSDFAALPRPPRRSMNAGDGWMDWW